MRYLDTLVQTDRLTVVMVEHVFNIPRVLTLATTVWTLAEGHLTVESKDAVQRNPGITTVSNLHDWLKEIAGPGGRVETHELKQGARLTTAIPKSTEDASVILEVKDLVVRRGYRTVLGGFSLTLRKGQLTLLEAPNGWGKSTLLDTIAGVLQQQTGEITFNGEFINTLSTDKRIQKGMGYLRARESVFGSLSIAEHQKLSKGTSLGFGENSHNGHIKANLLSGGQKQKLLIEMLPNARVYLLDEPFIGLDKTAISRLSESLGKMVAQGRTVLMAMPEGV
jgi:branched-chain amino acid transport system ATP-binding protein